MSNNLEDLLKILWDDNHGLANFEYMIKLDRMAKQIHQDNVDRGFWDNEIQNKLGELFDYVKSNDDGFDIYLKVIRLVDEKLPKGRSKGECIALMHSELSEALEGLRKDLQSDHIPELTAEEEEIADLMIRAFDYAGAYNLRLGEAIIAKLNYNKTRGYKHGKKF